MNESDKENIKEPYQSPTHAFTVLKQASFISSTEPNISTSHTFRCIKKRIPWSEEEDKLMKQLVNKYGTSNWTLISSKMGKSRNGKQCRERWYNQLNPSMKKNNWTTKEENILFSKHMQLGNKWADIASFLPGRTLTDIKNHFYSKLRKFIRQILKQINDEKLFQINGIDSYKYTGEKIYKMIKKHDITYKNLTKDTIFELIIATEKNPKGKFIFFNNEQNANDVNEYINNESTIGINNKNISYNLSNNFFIDETYENYNDKSKNMKNNINNNFITNNMLNNNYNNFLNFDTDLVNNNNITNFKLKLRKYSNISENKSEFNSLSNNNLKLIQNNKNQNKKNSRKKQKTDNDIKTTENKAENKLIGKKRKKSKKQAINEEKDKIIPELILSEQKPKKKNKKVNNKNNNINQNIEILNKNDISKNSLKEIKFFSRTEKNDKINNINFYPPFNISSPKELKNIQFPFSMTKSIRSLKPEDFSFSNKLNSLNDYLEPSLHKGQMLPIMNYDNLLFLHQKNKNNGSLMSDISYDNNLLNMNSKNDNTYKNFSINGNIYNKNIIQNNLNNANSINNLSINNNITLKSADEKEDKKNNDKPIIINMELINNQDFTNAFINGNTIEQNEKSQYNNSVYNKNNNNLIIFNQSSPPSVRGFEN